MALVVGVSGVECVAGVGRVCTRSGECVGGSGLFVAWEVALGLNFVGSGLRISFCGSSTASFPLPSSFSNGEIASFYCLQCSTTVVSIKHSLSGFSFSR